MNRSSNPDAAASGGSGRVARGAGAVAVARAVAVFKEWRRVSRSRRELAAFDDYQLRDIGLSRSQAQFESGKSFLRK